MAASLRILILGGTGFIGPDQVRHALARGHRVSVFNRGRSDAAAMFPGVEHLVGDRDGALDALRGRRWDVCIDNPTTLPVWVRDAARVLAGSVGRYVLVSTVSVYADKSQPDADESGALAEYTGNDPMRETLDTLRASGGELYGPLKVLAEREAEKSFPGRTLVLRPGLIAGPGDGTDRFTYWPVRLARGGRVLAPGDPGDPVQFIDVRDLAEWTIRMAEAGETGIYNVTGAAGALTMGGLLDGIRSALGSDAKAVWVNADFLAARNVEPWSDLPVWLPPRGEYAGHTRRSIQRALAKGLTFRRLSDTARDTLAWFRTLPPGRQVDLKAGLPPGREAELLAAWDAAVPR